MPRPVFVSASLISDSGSAFLTFLDLKIDFLLAMRYHTRPIKATIIVSRKHMNVCGVVIKRLTSAQDGTNYDTSKSCFIFIFRALHPLISVQSVKRVGMPLYPRRNLDIRIFVVAFPTRAAAVNDDSASSIL
jgi:hypothetical protein